MNMKSKQIRGRKGDDVTGGNGFKALQRPSVEDAIALSQAEEAARERDKARAAERERQKRAERWSCCGCGC